MKLTKGKISKILNKKKQSRKKPNNKKRKLDKNTKNARTFRRKRSVNLSNKTFKNLHLNKSKGGEGKDTTNSKKSEVETFEQQPVETTSTTTTSTPMELEQNEIKPVETVEEQPTSTTTSTPMETDNDVKPVEEVSESQTTPMETNDEVEPLETVETVEEDPTSTPMTTEDIFKPDENDEEGDPSLSTPTPSTPMLIEDDVKQFENVDKKYNDELPEDVSKSINTVMDFVTSKIANKININIPSNEGESNIQNGFNAVNEATEQMASSQTQNAGRKQKFRLTKKSRKSK